MSRLAGLVQPDVGSRLMSDLSIAIGAVVDAALAEDRAHEDITTLAIISSDETGTAALVAREPCVVAGLAAFDAVFRRLAHVQIEHLYGDGDEVDAHAVIARVKGPLRALLSAERVALNLVQRLCGVATLTSRYVRLAGEAEIRDTRKTTPGMRLLEKAAVVAGGGVNHRMTLADKVLIKDNHIIAAGGIAPAVQRVHASAPDAWIQVECDTVEQVSQAVTIGVDEVLLDNMDDATLADAVQRVDGRCKTEASGGITLRRIPRIAATGVDSISVGALTHSARAIDLSLEIESLGGA